jgi:hypothetical protein
MLLATAFLPMAVASADIFDLVPDPSTFDPTTALGYPPFYDELTGGESWNAFDQTTGTVVDTDILSGNDTQTTMGTFTNDDFLVNSSADTLVPAGSQLDFANFGSGFANEWLDIPGTGTGAGISDLLITPFGDFPLLGTFF